MTKRRQFQVPEDKDRILWVAQVNAVIVTKSQLHVQLNTIKGFGTKNGSLAVLHWRANEGKTFGGGIP